MIFQNYEMTPLGNAQLSINQQGNLQVSNIGNSGLDGVMIKVFGHDEYSIKFNEIIGILNGGVMRFTTIGKNSLNQLATTSEKIIWFNPTTNQVHFGYNMWLKPRIYRLFGELNEEEVFIIEKQNPVFDPQPQGVWIAIGAIATVVIAAAAVYEALKTTHFKKTVRLYEDGKLVKETIVEKTDPQEFQIIVDGQSYLVNNFGFKYENNFPVEDNVLPYFDAALIITGYNLDNFEITQIE